MKKLIYSAAALAMAFFAASCQQENLEPVAQESTVTFSVELPGVQTKAIGDGFNVDQLVYEVWKTEGENERDLKDTQNATRLYQEKATMARIGDEQKTVISLNLVHDQNYTILFWAQNSKAIDNNEPAYNTTDLTAVTYAKKLRDENFNNGEYLSNNENMAAFYGTAFIKAAEVEIPSTRRVELRRPFAQLNIGTMNTPKEYTVTMNQSRVKISNVPSVFDVAQNIGADSKKGIEAEPAVSDTLAFVFEYAALPEDPSKLKVNDIEYDYVAMNYIFADGNVDVQYWIDATLTAVNPTEGRNETTNAVVYNRVPQVPLKENYRTNIVGNLLTSTTQYEVVIDASWEDVYEENWDGNVVEVWDKKYIQEPKEVDGVYQISLASELAWLAAKVNGMPYIDPATNSVAYKEPVTFKGTKFVLVEDIDLAGALWNPIGANKALKYSDTFRGTFDGNGHVIKNLTVNNPEVAGLFGYMTEGTVENVVIDNFNLSANHYAGAIVGWVEGSGVTVDRCTVSNGEITVTVSDKDLGDKAGGIVGFAHSGTYTNNTVSGVVINGYRDLGGVAGNLQGSGIVMDNTVTNVSVTADLTPEYAELKAANAGMVVGRINSDKVTIDNNTTNEVDVMVIIDSVAEMNVAAGHDKTFIYMQPGEYDFDQAVNVDGTLQVKAGSDVVLNGNDFGVTVGTSTDYGFKVGGNGASLVINDAEITSKGGTIGAIEGAKVTVNGGSMFLSSAATSGRYLIYATGQGTEVVINGGNYSWDTTKNNKRAYVYTAAGATVYINGGTFAKASTRSGYTEGILGDGTVIITGGTFGFDPTAWVAPGYHVKKDGANWVVVSLSEGDNLKDAVAVAGATVNMAAGEYVFPSSSIAEGVTINCEEGTVFTGTSGLNINGATVIGATFSNPSGTVAGQTINGTFKNCTFDGANALRYAYAGETVVFEGCVFSGSTYGAHFDGGANDIIFKNCTFSGFNAFAAAIELVTFDGCTFIGNGKSGYNGANLWGSAKLINTEFVFNGTTANEWIDMIGVDKTYEMTNCTLVGGSVFDTEKIFSRNTGTKITINDVLYTWTEGDYLVDENGNVPTSSYEVMQAALNGATGTYTINILNDIAGDVVAPQKEDVKIVINGNGKNYDGMITVDGKSVAYATAGLTIKDLTFNATAIAGDACIRLGDGTTATRYTSNVTVENCTFDVPGAVGVKSYTGGDKNIKLTGCTANANAHSLLQAAGIHGVLVEECTINSKNGLNFNNSVDVVIYKCNADVRGYAARFGEGSAATGAAEAYAITNSTLKSACEDGDAVIILRGSADLATLTIENTTLEGTTLITNNANGAKVIIDGVEQ